MILGYYKSNVLSVDSCCLKIEVGFHIIWPRILSVQFDCELWAFHFPMKAASYNVLYFKIKSNKKAFYWNAMA